MITGQDINMLREIFATKGDLLNLEERLEGKFSNLQSSVDRYLQRTETWYQEQVLLKARHDRLSTALVDNGVVTDQEISILG